MQYVTAQSKNSQSTYVYDGTVKRHNLCKRHVSIDTGFKQTERAIFSMLFQWDKNWICFKFKCIFEETVSKFWKSYKTHRTNILALT